MDWEDPKVKEFLLDAARLHYERSRNPQKVDPPPWGMTDNGENDSLMSRNQELQKREGDEDFGPGKVKVLVKKKDRSPPPDFVAGMTWQEFLDAYEVHPPENFISKLFWVYEQFIDPQDWTDDNDNISAYLNVVGGCLAVKAKQVVVVFF